eukprot:CAMPEP_0118972816 /NCGR_PEP_ID=MMETSP1173-20130426/9016_1 /TAXON_ID=1034831 /ORGANISM="Rhizochromulina marina cf, Strain CCMP1243" /LENGTH=178 /DNA_ID=CAMNT_0006922399 /DNA_START=260 /DNA_END=796 /DNA_ORIENTATION=-
MGSGNPVTLLLAVGMRRFLEMGMGCGLELAATSALPGSEGGLCWCRRSKPSMPPKPRLGLGWVRGVWRWLEAVGDGRPPALVWRWWVKRRGCGGEAPPVRGACAVADRARLRGGGELCAPGASSRGGSMGTSGERECSDPGKATAVAAAMAAETAAEVCRRRFRRLAAGRRVEDAAVA